MAHVGESYGQVEDFLKSRIYYSTSLWKRTIRDASKPTEVEPVSRDLRSPLREDALPHRCFHFCLVQRTAASRQGRKVALESSGLVGATPVKNLNL